MRARTPSLFGSPGVAVLGSAVANSMAAWLCIAASAWAVSGVEGRPLPLIALALLLGPFAWALGVSLAVSGAVRRGEWSGWQALGHGPWRLSAGVLLLGAALGLASAQGGASLQAVPGWALPAPISPSVRLWPGDGGWHAPDLSRWTVAPAALSMGELLTRARARAPAGSRPGVDLAELVRRTGWALSWPLAALLGVAFGRRAQRGRSLAVALSATRAGGALGVWLLTVALLAAYASTIT